MLLFGQPRASERNVYLPRSRAGRSPSTSLGEVGRPQRRRREDGRVRGRRGELATQTATFGSTALFSETYDSVTAPRDTLGRITRKTETLEGVTTAYDYTYDPRGRLESVTENGSVTAEYTYDDNGNRTTATTPSGTVNATYDDQDRLLTYGPLAFTYGANGELESKTDTATGAVTEYDYDVFGNLKRVDLPTGDVIEYVMDGRNRRVGKKKNGVLSNGCTGTSCKLRRSSMAPATSWSRTPMPGLCRWGLRAGCTMRTPGS